MHKKIVITFAKALEVPVYLVITKSIKRIFEFNLAEYQYSIFTILYEVIFQSR